MLDDITQAVLAREDVARYLRGGHGQSELRRRERIHAYLDELRTTQRYPSTAPSSIRSIRSSARSSASRSTSASRSRRPRRAA